MDEPIYLRALETSDLDRLHKWHNDRSLYEMLGGPFRFVRKQATQAWLENKTAFLSYGSDEIRLAICVKGSDKHIGNISLHQINWIVRQARLEILIGDPEERSKGYGQAAVRQLLSYAFGDLGLRKIYLEALADNGVAIHLYEKCGFKIEGRFKNHVFKQGGWKDVIFFGIFADDYAPVKS